MKKILSLITVIVFSTVLFSQKSFLNTEYKLQKQLVKIALIPYYKNDTLTHAMRSLLMKDGLASVSLADSTKILNSITRDSLTNKIVNKLINKTYSNGELKNQPNLSSLINSESIPVLQQRLDNADLLLIPLSVKIRRVTKLSGKGSTTLDSRFKLYDLNNGVLVFDTLIENKISYSIGDSEFSNQYEVILNNFHSYYSENFIVRNNLK